MKEAYITDLNGRYIEPTLVADSVTGVFDRYENDDLIGYTVAITMPDGLYEPIYDVSGYRAAVDAYEASNAEYLAKLAEYDPESGTPEPLAPARVDGSLFWRNGLTDEQIEALKPQPQPSELDLLGAMMVQRELEALDLRMENQALGAQVVAKDLQIYDLKAQTGAQGSNLVELDVRVNGLEAKADV